MTTNHTIKRQTAFKQFFKYGLRKLVKHMPRGAQLVALDQILANLGHWTVLAQVAPRCGVPSLQVDGAYGRIQGPSNDSSILAQYATTGVWATRTNRIIEQFFQERETGTYVDVGANIGLTTIPVAKNPKVSCYAFEADPTNYQHLLANLSLNCRHGNVRTANVAIFSHSADVTLKLAPSNSGDHRLLTSEQQEHGEESSWEATRVRAEPLDLLLPSITAPLAIKIDTQGAEPFVFQGGQATIAKASLVVLEWAPYWLARLGGDPRTITSFLTQHAFRLAIAEGEEGELSPPPTGQIVAEHLLDLVAQYSDDPVKYFDVVAVR
jgi:FkbM family methyltransferase